MFKCRYISICIQSENVCDGTTDCPMRDDEIICENIGCVDQCTCLNYGISCTKQDLSKIHNLFSQLTHFVFIDISRSRIPSNKINQLSFVVTFLSCHDHLKQPFSCDSAGPDLDIKLLNLSFNEIVEINNNHFKCQPEIKHVILEHNKIRKIAEYTFKHSPELMSLYLQKNEITFLSQYSFSGIKKLHCINLLENDIILVSGKIFAGVMVKLILTINFHICCLHSDINSICTAKPMWPSSCEALLSTVGLKVVSWVVGFVVTIFNIISGTKIITQWYQSQKLKN